MRTIDFAIIDLVKEATKRAEKRKKKFFVLFFRCAVQYKLTQMCQVETNRTCRLKRQTTFAQQWQQTASSNDKRTTQKTAM